MDLANNAVEAHVTAHLHEGLEKLNLAVVMKVLLFSNFQMVFSLD